MIQGLALVALTLVLGAGALAVFSKKQEQTLAPTQQAYVYKMPEADAKRLIQAGQLLSRGDSVEQAFERMGKPNFTTTVRETQVSGELGVTQEMHYILASRGPIVPYTAHPNDTAVIVGIGQDKKVSYIKFVHVTGAVPGFRSDES
jgi:hypothetical protein